MFWEVDPADIQLPVHNDYVLERLMQRGDWNAMKWIRANFETAVLKEFMRRRGDRLAPRERAYWALVAGVAIPPATGGGRPSWAGP